MKTCSKCKVDKHDGEFQDGTTKVCKACKKIYQREWTKKNAKKPKSPAAKAYTKRWRKDNNVKYQAYKENDRLRRAYGFSFIEYNTLLAIQGGTCAICHKPDPCGRRLSVDHSHETGRVRGLLCLHCNRAIGLVQDNPETLRSAADYIDFHANNDLRDVE